jgi:hypothetical protein
MPRKRLPTVGLESHVIVIDVRAVTTVAFCAGLTVDLAQDALLDGEMDDCRVVGGVCPECSAETSFLIALRAFAGRDVVYCEECRVADVGV